MIGKSLNHYEIESMLGAGGMGEVYQARDTRLGRSVAVKVLPEAFAHDADRAARFEREAKLLAALNHPNIAALYGLEHADGRHFLVMELVEGESLAEALERGHLAGAGLDVFAEEPKVPERLLRLRNVTLLPHVGSATLETRTAMGMLAVDNLAAFFAGRPLPARVV